MLVRIRSPPGQNPSPRRKASAPRPVRACARQFDACFWLRSTRRRGSGFALAGQRITFGSRTNRAGRRDRLRDTRAARLLQKAVARANIATIAIATTISVLICLVSLQKERGPAIRRPQTYKRFQRHGLTATTKSVASQAAPAFSSPDHSFISTFQNRSEQARASVLSPAYQASLKPLFRLSCG